MTGKLLVSSRRFKANDPRKDLACKATPLVNFVLTSGTKGQPSVRVLRPSSVEGALREAAAKFLEEGLVINTAEKIVGPTFALTQQIEVPQLLEWYSGDFAKSLPETVKSLSSFVSDKGQLEPLLNDPYTKFVVKPFVWDFFPTFAKTGD